MVHLTFLVLAAAIGCIQAYPLLQYAPGYQYVFQEPVPDPWFEFGRGLVRIQPEGVVPQDDDAVAPTEDETIMYMPIKRGKKPQKLQTGYFDYDLSNVNLNIDTGAGWLHDYSDDDGDEEDDDGLDVHVPWTDGEDLILENNGRSLFVVAAGGRNDLDDEDDYLDDDDDDDYHHHNKYAYNHHDLWGHKKKVGSHRHGHWGYDTYKYPLDVFHAGSKHYSHPLDKYHNDGKYNLGMSTLYHSLKGKYNNKYLSHGHGHHHDDGWNW